MAITIPYPEKSEILMIEEKLLSETIDSALRIVTGTYHNLLIENPVSLVRNIYEMAFGEERLKFLTSVRDAMDALILEEKMRTGNASAVADRLTGGTKKEGSRTKKL